MLPVKKLCHLLCVVRNYHVGACSFYRCYELRHDRVFVDPALYSSCLDQCIFARYTVCTYRNISDLSSSVYKIEVWYGGLDHDNVNTLCNICLYLTHSFSCI